MQCKSSRKHLHLQAVVFKVSMHFPYSELLLVQVKWKGWQAPERAWALVHFWALEVVTAACTIPWIVLLVVACFQLGLVDLSAER
jgi:hypothetical protein